MKMNMKPKTAVANRSMKSFWKKEDTEDFYMLASLSLSAVVLDMLSSWELDICCITFSSFWNWSLKEKAYCFMPFAMLSISCSISDFS
jgi:hypothetical protein